MTQTNNALNQYSYDTEKFFETNNDNLIDIKNIFESRLFWERVNTFFDIKVYPTELELLSKFYLLTPQQV